MGIERERSSVQNRSTKNHIGKTSIVDAPKLFGQPQNNEKTGVPGDGGNIAFCTIDPNLDTIVNTKNIPTINTK